MKKSDGKVVNIANFVGQNADTKNALQPIIRYLCRETNRHKLNYRQLKYIFRSVRERCEVDVPTGNGRKLIELPTRAELSEFYRQITNPTHRLIFEVLENTGLRVAELCGLQVKRIDFHSNLVFVSEGKGKRDRVTVIGNRLKEKLSIFLQGRNNKYLFESNRHTKFTSRRIEQLCKTYKEKAGIEKDLTPHTFRHLWNTRLAEGGLSREQRAILAGHSNEKTQDIYTHLGAGGIKNDAILILDEIFR